MELAKREFRKIFEYYGVSDLELLFDGFEWVTPDKVLYYFHDSKGGELYAIELADYIHEFDDNDEPLSNRIVEDYWAERSCDWEVERWFSNEGDYFYWPECGDKCVFAKLKADTSALASRSLKHDVSDASEEEMVKRKEALEDLIEIDSQR